MKPVEIIGNEQILDPLREAIEKNALCGCYLDVQRGVVKVTDVDPADYRPIVPGLPAGAYHIYDYQFFFKNLQENVKHRVELYMEQAAAAEQAA